MNIQTTSLAFVLMFVQGNPMPSAAADDSPELVISPVEATFRGRIEIDARVIWLNGQDLTIADAALTTTTGERLILEAIPTEKSFVAFRANRVILAGKDTIGIFRQKEGDAWCAFPCIDEPDVKVPWQVNL